MVVKCRPRAPPMSAVPLFAVAIYGCGWTAFTDGNEARFDVASACRNRNGFVVMKYAERFGCVGKNGVGDWGNGDELSWLFGDLTIKHLWPSGCQIPKSPYTQITAV